MLAASKAELRAVNGSIGDADENFQILIHFYHHQAEVWSRLPSLKAGVTGGSFQAGFSVQFGIIGF